MITGKYSQKVWKRVSKKCSKRKNETNTIGEEVENISKRLKKRNTEIRNGGKSPG